MRGFVNSSKTSNYKFPENWEGLDICLKFVGGVGDVLIAIGGSAKTLKSRECKITACVRDNHVELAKLLDGVDDVIRVSELRTAKNKYDVIVDFYGVLNYKTQLKADNYYKLVGDRLGLEVSPGKLKINRKVTRPLTVALHCSASNPNRVWPSYRWEALSIDLINRGLKVLFLGLSHDYGYSREDGSAIKYSDISLSLVDQARVLSECAYFIGNDSGFCHIAGILGIPGIVLFGVTHPKDVIGNYPSLTGVHNFDKFGEPSRSLSVSDWQGRICMDSICIDQVVSLLPLDLVYSANSSLAENVG